MTSYENIFQSLNEEQTAAVKQQEGPVLIIAGAGSGKTRVLTSKIALHLQDGAQPDEILALTFTKKAAGEMKWRIKKMIGEEAAKGLAIGTFHSVFVKFLRIYHEFINFPEDFTIYDENDSESCLKACVGETLFGPDWNDKEKNKALTDEQKKARKAAMNRYKPHDIRGIISLAKNNMILPKQYRADPVIAARDRKYGRERLGDIYSLYMRKCHLAGAMDFDDILVYTEFLLRRNPEILKALATKFRYILVDEYQDTNRVQYDIVTKLASVHRNICVVGDDSQSIYAFRGAKIENILHFKDDYPEMQTFRLELNYRSTPQIVDAANLLISHNEERIPKTCTSRRREGEPIRLQFCEDDREEARFVKSYIQEEVRRRGIPYSSFAVLYRTNAQARALEDELIRSQVPYLIYSGTSFFDRAEVKDALAYMRLVVNPSDNEAFKRVCNRPARGISDATLSVIEAVSATDGAPLMRIADGADPANVALKEKPCKALKEFAGLIYRLRGETAGMDAYEATKAIIEATGIREYYQKEDGEDGVSRANNVMEILTSAMYYVQDARTEWENDLPDGEPATSLRDYLENISLLSNADTPEESTDHVSLMTSHCSKGLEYRTVFVVGVEEGLYPLIREDSTHFDEEEERRLFYVSVTRAMDRLILTTCGRRWIYGSPEAREPSRFIKEMGLEVAEVGEGSAAGDASWSPLANAHPKPYDDDDDDYVPVAGAVDGTEEDF